MKRYLRLVARLRDDAGASAVEYGLMVALIAAVIIGTVAALGGPVMGLYQRADWWNR